MLVSFVYVCMRYVMGACMVAMIVLKLVFASLVMCVLGESIMVVAQRHMTAWGTLGNEMKAWGPCMAWYEEHEDHRSARRETYLSKWVGFPVTYA